MLIYGARANGILTLQYILHNKALSFNPVGFLDDDPALEGKNISGYTVFGGHWMLKRVLRKHPIDEILIASDTMKPEILNRIKQFADEFKIAVHRRKFFLEELTVPSPAASKRKPIVLKDSLEPSINLSH